MEDESRTKIDSLSIDELKKNIYADKIYGSVDSEKSRYAQYILQLKEKRELDDKYKALLFAFEGAATKIAKFIDKLIASLTNETDKIIASNEKLSKSQEKWLLGQIITSICLVVATVGLIIATLAR